MNTLKTLIVALTITSGAVAQSDIYEVPQDFGPTDFEYYDDTQFYTGVDYVIVDAMSTMHLTTYWGSDVVNPNSYTWAFTNATDTVMHWDSFSFGRNIHRFDLAMTLQHRAPAWGRNVSEISMTQGVVPGPGAMGLMAIAGLVARGRRRR